MRKGTLPGVRHLLAARSKFIAPGELGAVEPAAGCEFPLRFGRQVLARPFRIGHRVAIGNVNDGMIIEPGERAARAEGPLPIRAELECPPLTPVAEIDRVLWGIEN